MPDKPVVLWDVDGTISRVGLETQLFRYLRDQHVIDSTQLLGNVLGRLFTWPPPQWYQMKLVYLRGLKREDVDGWIKECFGQSLEEILFAGSVNAVRQLAQAGLPQVLLTGAPRPLAERIGDYLRVDDIIAAEPEYSDGVYTGGLIGKHPRGRRKIGFAASWLKVNGYEWSDTIGLGNHYDDRFLLEQAGVGIAVNPDRRLYRLAQARGWEIVTEPNQDFSVLSLADGRPL